MVVVASACLASCTTTEKELNIHSKNGTLSVMASVADFATLNVGTKAISDDEAKVNEITMVIFDANNIIVGKPVNLDGSGSVFMIDTENSQIIDGNNTPIAITNDQAALDDCTIYMVANSWSEINGKAINDSTALLDINMPVAGIQIPSTGFPMIGAQRGFDLSKDRGDATTVANITMKKLYAKVNVRFQINAEQVIKTPKFNLQSWQVKNVPNKVHLGYSETKTPFANAEQENMLTSAESTTLSYGVQTISHSESATNPDYFQFTFYVPEHKVQPPYTRATYPKYPTSIPEAEKQRYKPLLCFNTDGSGDNKPMHVIVKGSYTDHHGQVKEVTYSLYLGQNNTDDYCILRNQELNNIITIKGLTNNKDAVEWNDPDNPDQDNISVDHRVEVGQEGFSIAMEREALLDSHFEVRPMDVFVSTGGKVIVSVNNDESITTDDWLRIEQSTESDAHIENIGVRKYFTTDLVTNTLKNSTTITILGDDTKETTDSRIWLYFDENTNVYDKTLNNGEDPKYRDIKLTVKYYKNKDAAADATPDATQDFTFRQMNLWRVRGTTHYYDIEYHEEYLHNYVSNDNYGKSTDGMEWGLNGLQLSDTDIAFVMKSKLNLDFITQFFTNNSAASNYRYDFYISEEESNCIDYLDSDGDNNTSEKIYHPYNGLNFTKKIVNKALNTTNPLSNTPYLKSNRPLDEDAESAIEYCYNKNKRNATGGVVATEWYLPAIDEIEDIVENAYADFSVFQNKFYWSSQPAFVVKNWKAKFWVILTTLNYDGTLYIDNLNYARATKVNYINNTFKAAESAMHNPNETLDLGYIPNTNTPTPSTDNAITPTFDEGYKPRVTTVKDDAIHRIRCVRNSGLVSSLSSSN